jgi:PAS domain S-box-containing protein
MKDDRFRSLFENSADAQFLSEGDIFVDCNSAALQMMGCSRKAEILGHHPHEFSPPTQPDGRASLDKARQMLTIALAKGSHRFECVHRRTDGTEFSAEISLTALTVNGKLLVHGAVRDVTDRDRSQRALRASEQRYRTLCQNVGDGFVAVDMGGRFIEANPAYLDMLGYSLDELLNLTYKEVTPKQWHAMEEAMVEQTLKRGYSDLYQKEYVRKDGQVIPVELRTHVFRDEHGKPTEMWAFVRNITERKLAEQALTKERDRAQTYFDVAGIMLTAIEADQTVSLVNRKGCEILECEEEEIIGTNWFNTFVPERDKERVKGAFAQLLAGEIEPVEYFENAVVTKSGQEKIIAWHNTVLRDQTGKVIRSLSSGEDITERRKAEQALRESEERYRTAIEASDDGVVIIKEGRHVYVNRKFLQMHGYDSPEEIVGKSIAEAVHLHPEDRQSIIEMEGERKKGEPTPTRQDARVVRKDGSVAYVEASVTSIVYQGEPATLVCLRDITDRKRAEETLKESEERYRIAIEHSNDGVAIIKGDQHVYVNQRFLDLHGYETPEEIIGKSTSDATHVHPDDREMVIKMVRQRQRGEPTPSRYRHKAVHKDGRVLHVEISATRIVYQGEPASLVYVRDVTEHEQAEELFQQLFQSLPVAIFLAADGVLRMTSTPLHRLTGYSQNELAEADLSRIVHPKDRQSVREQAIAMLKGKTMSPYEFRILTKEGQVRWVMGSVISIPYHGRRATLGSYMDITERKLLESQLVQAQKLESIGQLAAGIAHEINTPTQYVGDNIHFLKESFAEVLGLTEKYRELFEAVRAEIPTDALVEEIARTIEKADIAYLKEEIPKAIEQSMEGVERVAGIVRAMKEFSHPGTKEKQLVDINKAIENTLTVSRNVWKYVADVVTEFDPNLPLAPCLLGEFNQVILNLIINAAHAIAEKNGTSAEKGSIRVSTLNREGWVEIRISDTGPGIPEEIRSRIFDPFFTTKEVGKGTGQGLAIARSIVVDKHGGNIAFDTVPEEGTTFIIRLPLEDGEK